MRAGLSVNGRDDITVVEEAGSGHLLVSAQGMTFLTLEGGALDQLSADNLVVLAA